MYKFLVAFDRFMNRSLMNPAFRWIQRFFHINRYRLIAAAMYGKYVAVMAAGAGVCIWTFSSEAASAPPGAVAMTVMLKTVLLLWIFHGIRTAIRIRVPDLLAAADRIETGHSALPSPRLISWAATVTVTRPITGPFQILFGLFLFGTFAADRDFTTFSLLLFITAEFTEIHLYGSDDVDPDERERLFDQKRERHA